VVDMVQLKALLSFGGKIKNEDYCRSCRIHNAKTFYLFCKRLAAEPRNTELPSRDLNEYILTEVWPKGVQINKRFNPHGWFGRDWTEWESFKMEPTRLFRGEFCDVLLRSSDKPYSYGIKAEYLDIVKELLRKEIIPR